MNDIIKSKPNKEASTKMTLDDALKVIEASDILIKQEIATLASHPVGKQISAYEVATSSCHKIGFGTICSTFLSMFGVAWLGPEATPLLVAPGIGFVSLIGIAIFPGHLGKVFSPKKSKELKRQETINDMFNELAQEEFQRKEQQILQDAKTAWDFANKELESQGRTILYASNAGFSIESTKPLNVSQWDALRLEAVRTKGAKAVGIRPKVKELTA